MKANELFQVSLQNSETYESVISMCESQAEFGQTSAGFIKNVPFPVITKLMSDGFKISKHMDPINGMQQTIVSFNE